MRHSAYVVVRPKHIYNGDDGDGAGEEVYTLYNYTSFGRAPADSSAAAGARSVDRSIDRWIGGGGGGGRCIDISMLRCIAACARARRTFDVLKYKLSIFQLGPPSVWLHGGN